VDAWLKERGNIKGFILESFDDAKAKAIKCDFIEMDLKQEEES